MTDDLVARAISHYILSLFSSSCSLLCMCVELPFGFNLPLLISKRSTASQSPERPFHWIVHTQAIDMNMNMDMDMDASSHNWLAFSLAHQQPCSLLEAFSSSSSSSTAAAGAPSADHGFVSLLVSRFLWLPSRIGL